MSSKRLKLLLCILLGATFSASGDVNTAEAAPNFKGKRVQLIIASSPGGGTDRIGRLLSQYMEKNLEGNPTIVIKNMGSGGGKIRAANYLMKKAKPDGLTFMQSDATVVSPSTLRRKSARYDPTKFEFIGALNRGGSIFFINKKAQKRLMDKSKKPVIVAAISGTRNWQAMPLWGAEFLGWNVRWIPGYRGVGQMSKALRQGEIDMFATNNAYTIKQLQDDGVINLISQAGQVLGGKLSRRLSYKDVPVFTEMLKSGGKKKIPLLAMQAYGSLTTPAQVDKWMGMPPRTPKDYVEAFREAYKASVNDPAFLKIARKQFSKEINYIDGKTVAKLVAEVNRAPTEAVDYAEELKQKYGLTAFKNKIYIFKGKITKIKKKGKSIKFKGGSKKGKVKVGKKTIIKIGGKAAKRKMLKVGMSCTFKTKGIKNATNIDCK